MGSDHRNWNQEPVALDRLPPEVSRRFMEAERERRLKAIRRTNRVVVWSGTAIFVAIMVIWILWSA